MTGQDPATSRDRKTGTNVATVKKNSVVTDPHDPPRGADLAATRPLTSNAAVAQTGLGPTPAIAALKAPSVQSARLGIDVPLRISIDHQKPFWQEASLWVSVVAVMFSIATLIINYRASNSKDAKARRQSINDEFWLRKVLFPLAIEPAVTYYAALQATLPADRFTANATSSALQAFNDAFVKEQALLRSKNVSVGILSQPLSQQIQLQQEAIEDVVTNYCAANSKGYDPLDNPGVETRADAVTQISSALLAILTDIKNHQETIT